MPVTLRLVIALHLGLSILPHVNQASGQQSTKLPDCSQSVIEAYLAQQGQNTGGPSGPNGPWIVRLSKSKSGGDSRQRNSKPCKTVSECASGEGCVKIACEVPNVAQLSGQGCALCSHRGPDDNEAHGMSIDGCGSGNLQVFNLVVLFAFVAMSRFPVLFQSQEN